MPENDAGNAPKDNGGDEGSVAVAIPEQPHGEPTQAERDAKQEQEIQELKRREKVLFRVAVFGAFIALASAIVSTLQWDVMRDQLADARASGADSGVATLRAYRLGRQQADATTTMAQEFQKQTANVEASADSANKLAKATSKLADANVKSSIATQRLAESAAQSSIASQRLADAANEANIVSRDLVTAAQQTDQTNRNVQRAFVFVRSFAAEQLLDYWWLHIELENAGNTPTRNLVIRSYCAAVPYGTYFGLREVEPDVFKVDGSNKTLWAHPPIAALLGPHQPAFIRSCLIPGALTLAGYRIESPLYVWGTADYKDILHGSAHRTEFCFRIDIAVLPEKDWTRVVGKKQPIVESAPCQQHNCVDEECEKGDSRKPSP